MLATSRPRRFLLLGACVTAALLTTCCATLPSVRLARELPLTRPGATLSIEGPDGEVPAPRARLATLAFAELGAGNVLDEYLQMSERLIGAPLIIGNRVDLLVDGPATYAAMFDAIAAARRTIDIESYIFDDVKHAEQSLSRLLAGRVAAGVSVRLLVDGVGSWGADARLRELEALGIRTCVFNPLAPSLANPARLNHRDHRKLVIVDGDDGFAGGINFSRVYRTGSFPGSRPRGEAALDEGWRDTHVRIRGAGARRLAELFAESWAKQDCPGPAAAPDAGPVEKAGETVVQIVPSSPDGGENLTYVSVLGAVTYAQRSIAVTMAYFVPDDELEDALMRAARRGVDVRMILPAFSDFTGVFHAGRAHYERLLEAGVRIYEEEDAFLHAKTVVVDGIWSTVGSTNWDWRSFDLNDEVSVVVIDEAFAGRMTQLFERDLAGAREVTLAEWRERPWTTRLKERFWTAFERLL